MKPWVSGVFGRWSVMKSPAREHVLGRLGLLDAELAVALVGDERVEGEHAHAEGAGARRDELADPAEAEHAERLALDLGAAELAPLPLAAGEAGVGLRDVAREREHQRDRVLRRRHRVGLGGVGDDDALLGGGGDVDVVHADAGAADDAEVVGAFDQLRVALRGGADQDAVVVADPLEQVVAAPVGADVDVEPLAQHVHAGLGDLLRDEDAERLGQGHAAAGTPASTNTFCAAPTPAPCSTSWPSWASTISTPLRLRQDVEGAEVAAVGDPQDLALQVVLAAVGGDAELSQGAGHLAAVDRARQLERGDDGGALVRVAVELEAEAGDAGAGGAGEQVVAGEDVVQALLLDQVERDVERLEERDRRA